MDSITKKCSKCGESKTIEANFQKRSDKPHLLKSWCNQCLIMASRKWKESNPEKSKAYNREWQKTNKETRRGYSKKSSKKNNERSVAWRKNNPERAREISRVCAKKYMANNPGKRLEKDRNRRAMKRLACGKVSRRDWDEILRMYGGRCIVPECNTMSRISMDHVVPLKLGGSNTVDNIQPMCISHNSSKGARAVDYRALFWFGMEK